MYGPAVRCKRFSSIRCTVLHQCIRPLLGAVLLRAIMDISAHAISLADRPRLGHLGHQCSHAPGRPISPSSFHPLADLGRTKLHHRWISSFLFLCLCLAAVPSSRPLRVQSRRAQGPSRLAVAQALPLASMLPGHALYEAFQVKRYFAAFFTFFISSSQFLCSTWNPVSSSRPTCVGSRRAQGLSRPAVALLWPPLNRFQAEP
jgi:hypothetical protein